MNKINEYIMTNDIKPETTRSIRWNLSIKTVLITILQFMILQKRSWNIIYYVDAQNDNMFDTPPPPRPRVVNGDDAIAGQYPWFAMAMFYDEWYGCGGTLISAEFILTAGKR